MAQFENREMQQHFDKSRGESAGAGKMKAEDSGEREGHEENMKDVVEEHGPAEEVEIHSHHADGHVHKSKGHDHASGKKHMAEAFGEEPEEAEAEPSETPEHESASIPTMA